MKWDIEKLKELNPTQRRSLLNNARSRAGQSSEAKALVELIETSGLSLGPDQSVRLDDAVGKAMHRIIFSEEGKKAALAATSAGQPALAGVDPLLAKALGRDYGAHNEATVQAGYLVTNLMEQLGFEKAGAAPLPSGCVAKTGQIFRKSTH